MLKLFVAAQLRFAELRDREEGQAMAEYGIILALIAVVVIGSIVFLGKDIKAAFDSIVSQI